MEISWQSGRLRFGEVSCSTNPIANPVLLSELTFLEADEFGIITENYVKAWRGHVKFSIA